MGYKVLQRSPLCTRETHPKILIKRPGNNPPMNSGDVTLWRWWAVYDSAVDVGHDAAEAGLNWNALLGLAVVVGVSASFWAGLGITLSHLMK